MALQKEKIVSVNQKHARIAKINFERSRDYLMKSQEKANKYSSHELKFFAATRILETLGAGKSGLIFRGGLPDNVPNTVSFISSFKYLEFHLSSNGSPNGHRMAAGASFDRLVSMEAPFLQSIGWLDKSQEMISYAWGDYIESLDKDQRWLHVGLPRPDQWVNHHSNPYLVHKPAWFTTMTCVDPAIWRDKYGYDPDPDSLGPYYVLAQVWDDPDPEKVRNALTAVRELNVATAMIDTEKLPEGRVPYLVDGFLLLYDYDIRSVNMRRIAKGLAPVEVENYIYDYDLPLEPLPFAIDDVFYPAYCRMCEEIGVAPYVPENPIEVRLDVDNVRIERVD